MQKKAELTEIVAGFPSPARDYLDKKLDLNEYLISNPAATFFVRARGKSMLGAGIHPGDILIVDRSLSPQHGHIVVAILNGEFTVKRLCLEKGKLMLRPENSRFSSIEVKKEEDFSVWGVVLHVIHPLC